MSIKQANIIETINRQVETFEDNSN